jgi:phosphatidylserine synthase
MVDALRRSFIGLGFTAIFTFAALTFLMMQDIQAPVTEIWKNMLGSMVMGVYFGAASKLFDNDEWSPLKQTAVHFFLSLSIWFPLALYIGWLPFHLLPIIMGIGIFIVVYLIFWFTFYAYFKRLENEMNNTVRR